MRLQRQHWAMAIGAFAASIGIVLTVTGAAFAQAQPQMSSVYVSGDLPMTDPSSEAWSQALAIEVPLTPQRVTLPMLTEGSIETMQVKSLNNGSWIAFRLEWADGSKNERAIAQDQFRDAAAIQLPVTRSVPGVCMGVRGQPVNLWHWKADWQADIDGGFQDLVAVYPNFWKDYYPFVVGTPPFKSPVDFADPDAKRYLVGWAVGNPLSEQARVTPVEELVAHGFGTASSRSIQAVLGRGTWNAGKWSVVFARPMSTDDPSETQFVGGERGFIAVAAWNGANQEVGARKQISADVALVVEKAPVEQAPPQVVVPPPPSIGAFEKYWWIGFIVIAAALVGGAALLGHFLAGARAPDSAGGPQP
ncbi:MAG: hypothetical protein HY682_11485 [Chloroflexi bacterium]|nr:hypothetical protein [Chloroflexota bacterium]